MHPADCLTALLSKVKRHRIVVYDLESKDGPTQKPGFTRVFLAGVYDGARFESFRNIETGVAVEWEERGHKRLIPPALITPWELRAIGDGGCLDQMMRYLLSNAFRGAYIYAHNGGNFDHLHILPWLRARTAEFKFSIVPIQSSIQVLKVQHRTNKQTWTFLDSFRLLPMGLDQASKTFGFAGKLTHDLSLHEDDPKWVPYLDQDCKALYEALTQFQSLLTDKLNGEMGITAPSSAMKLYRRKFMGHGKTPAMIPQHRHFKECKVECEGCMHAWIRRGYYGGRVEVFRPRGEGVSYYDINSSYPRAMLEDMPGGEVRQYGPKKGPEDFRIYETSAVGFVEATVQIPDSCYLPPLPHRDERTGKLLFPVGRFSGVWAWSELKLLFDPLVQGSIVRIQRSVWYERKNLFFDFVKELYAYRDKLDPHYEEGLALVSKLMMNSLYGKFGMNEDRREILILGPGENAPEGATFPRLEDGEEDVISRVCYVEKRVSPPYIIPQISAQITALARVRLWHFMANVLRQGGKLYYCDTDSLITNLDSLRCSSELGELKNEYPGEYLTVELVGPKMYLLEKRKPFEKEHLKSCKGEGCKGCATQKLAMKGVPKDMRTVDTLRAFQRGEEVSYPRLEKLGAMAGRQFVDPPRMRTVKKSLKTKNDKRVMLYDVDSQPRKVEEPYEEDIHSVKLEKRFPTRSRANGAASRI